MNLLTQTEAAALLRRSVETIYRLRRSGALPSIPGRPVMIDLADLENYIQKLKEHHQWQDTQPGQSSKKMPPGISKYAGQKTEGPSDFQRGQARFRKLRRS